MSFFDDDDDEPSPRATRTQVRRKPPPLGLSEPRRTDQQTIRLRRAILVGALIVVVLAAALLIRSCQSSAAVNGQKDYAASVDRLISASNRTGQAVFGDLAVGASVNTQQQLSINLATALDGTGNADSAASVLHQAQGLSVPSEMQTPQQSLLLVLQLRYDAIAELEKQIQPAVSATQGDRTQAVKSIANAMARFYSSDVLYKDYVLPGMVTALNNASVPIGGVNGVQLDSDQILPDLGWLNPAYVSTKLGVAVPVKHKFIPGLHGHSLSSVNVAGVTLAPAPGSNPSIPSSPAPTFTLNFTNGGNFDEFNVRCFVSVTGLSDTGTAIVQQTFAGKPASCPVTLPRPPAPGLYRVTATIGKVRGEKDTANNSLTFAVTFK